LTEHQKETLKKKREDIPALYNDLSQSSSQDTQNLQQWFDVKVKHINESDKTNKKNDSTQKSIDNEANKENKLATKQVEFSVTDKIVDHMYCSKFGENIADIKQNDDLNEIEKESSDDKQEEDTSKQTNLISHTTSLNEENITSEINEEVNIENPTVTVAKRLNFESREEFPEDKMHERASPSMLDSIKRRHRNSVTKSSSSPKKDKTVESQKEQIVANTQKMSKVKIAQEKSDTNGKKSNDDTDIKEGPSENKKGVKRKYMSDTESDNVIQRRKRKLMSNKNLHDDGETSRSNNVFSDIDMDSVSQRTRNEISRLKIDMVFDCHSVNRRRVKHSDEAEKETSAHGKKYGISDTKSFKPKPVDMKSTEGSKKSSKMLDKNTKDPKDADDADMQGTFKRRYRKSTKSESDKCDLDVCKEVRKSNNFTDKTSESKYSVDAETTHPASVQQASQDIATNKVLDEKRNKDDSKCNTNVENSEVTETSKQSQDEIEDVVESSQTSNVGLKLDKKCGEKQCFIKINKITNVYVAKVSDSTVVEKNSVPESIPADCSDNDVIDQCEIKQIRVKSNAEMDNEENKDSTNKDSSQETDNSDKKIVPADGQKIIDSSSIKSVGIINFTSPKSSNKISRSKSFTGRAAHMLGLVTKQSRIDDSNVILDDELPTKKLKTKDENETSTSKKISTMKEIDKIAGPSGSRQEKIFSNMRSADYYASTNHAFTTLKNDGEKLSFKSDRSMSDYLSTEASGDKENEGNVSPLRERDNLPILEWSSANPPSLTASPSASILKRHRPNVSEPDLDSSTPSKVGFSAIYINI